MLDKLVEFHPAVADFARISITELQAALSQARGAKFVTLYTRTKPDLLANAPFHDLVKYSRVNGVVNWSYGEAVRKQQVREGQEPDFTPHARKWGTRLAKSPFVSHVKDGQPKLYLELKVQNALGHQYRDHNDCTIVADATVEPFLRGKDNTGQPVEKEVILRDYDMDNVLAITISGQSFVIER